MYARTPFLLKSVAMLLCISTFNALAAEEVNVYSARKEKLIKSLLDRFTGETGIQVNLVTGKADALLKRLQIEGRNSPADLLITTDAGRLHRAKEAGVTQVTHLPDQTAALPNSFRDPDGHWYGLSLRARPILYVQGRVKPEDLSSYEALAEPTWKSRVCIRSSNNIYNQSLVASMIAAKGTDRVETWARGFVGNFARPPKGGDRDQIKAAAAGQCDIAIANTYYLAAMIESKDPAQREAAGKLRVFWPNQDGRGTHVNVSGAAVTASARNRENATKLIAYLLNDTSQQWYADTNGEFPIRPDIPVNPVLASWGEFKMDTLNLSRLGELNPEAVRLMDRAGWK
ncbi:MAG: Fe(3+) ABC transporter substrate-binding protein [Gammaproteobacteria bacterium]|nr:Fe(3+) ABC transporter substrate-binding protein [Gammaproteobacteria bacterium]